MSIRTLCVFVCAAISVVAAPGAGARVEGAGSCTSAPRALQAHAGATAEHTFNDYIQDTAGPDICGQNVVTNDNGGTITFALHIHNRSTYVDGERYGVLLDTDNNAQTGPEGAEYMARVGAAAVELAKWNGTDFVTQSTAPPARWVSGLGPVFQLKAGDLGGVTNFGFFFYTTDGVNVDFAPDAGSWSYQLTPLQLSARGIELVPARAGQIFGARLQVMRSDLNAPLTEGTITCSARIGTASVRGIGRFFGPGAVCTWSLPRSSRGKRMTGSVAVTFQGMIVKKSFAVRIR